MFSLVGKKNVLLKSFSEEYNDLEKKTPNPFIFQVLYSLFSCSLR